jgi:hypothetical protein
MIPEQNFKTQKMKQLILFFIFLFIGKITYSQIITASSRPVAGDVFQYKTDTIYIDTNTTGMNVTWDFSSLILPDSIYTNNHVATSSTPLASYFSNSNYAVGSWYFYTFYLGTNLFIEEIGNSNISGCPIKYLNPLKIMKFPFTYGDTLNDSFSFFNDCPMGEFSGSGLIHVKGDGLGTLILPSGTYSNVLRVKTVFYEINIGGGNIKNIKFEWYQSGKKFPLISYYSRQNGSSNPPIVFIKKLTLWENESYLNDRSEGLDAPINLNPNPASSHFNFNNNEKYTKLVLLDMAGRTIAQYEIQANQINGNIDISNIKNGVYLLQLSNTSVVTNKKLVINH